MVVAIAEDVRPLVSLGFLLWFGSYAAAWVWLAAAGIRVRHRLVRDDPMARQVAAGWADPGPRTFGRLARLAKDKREYSREHRSRPHPNPDIEAWRVRLQRRFRVLWVVMGIGLSIPVVFGLFGWLFLRMTDRFGGLGMIPTFAFAGAVIVQWAGMARIIGRYGNGHPGTSTRALLRPLLNVVAIIAISLVQLLLVRGS
jgi:hypothetical protein